MASKIVAEIVSIDLIGNWEYDVPETVCQICRNNLNQRCVTCKFGTCYVSKGTCGHAFHNHCVTNWLRNSSSCPVDRTPWVYMFENMDSRPTNTTVLKKKVN